jgi:hypothetical protein
MTSIPILPDDRSLQAAYSRKKLRGRDKAVQQRGTDYRIQIIALEDELADARTNIERLTIDLDRARRTATRLSELSPGLCFQLRRQLAEKERTIKQQDLWLQSGRRFTQDLKEDLALAQARFDERLAILDKSFVDQVSNTQRATEKYNDASALAATNLVKLGLSSKLGRRYREERDNARAQLAAAEQALRHTQRDRASTSAQLVACQARLLAFIDAGPARCALPGAIPAPSITIGDGSTPVTPILECTPRLSSPRQDTIVATAAADFPSSPATVPSFGPHLEPLHALLRRDPGADLSAYNIPGGEPVSDDDCPLAVSPRRLPSSGSPSRPISVASASTADSGALLDPNPVTYDPPTPRPDGATSPATSLHSSHSISPGPYLGGLRVSSPE